MRIDNYGQQVYSEMDLCSLIMQDPDRTLRHVLVDRPIVFDDSLLLNNLPRISEYRHPNVSVDEFDLNNQRTWYMPESYAKMDIAKWVLDQCKSEEELQRAGDELLRFGARDMFPLLCYLKYLVDTMRQFNVVWGVGRGSSVASFVLFLIGIHRINSLKYQLNIDEFLKN